MSHAHAKEGIKRDNTIKGDDSQSVLYSVFKTLIVRAAAAHATQTLIRAKFIRILLDTNASITKRR